ncbi:TlpA disulfide reductase family protein [Pseudoflavitalea rhizosphaerae]|uniref:TlpA disulfide reductase family protein n=1 Tax=Pseudoflavitalea rhizosphaerae TaxID=1884793 RepID=UPI000F8CD8D9|nr:TlpA disulfide reductase family protein [Pseudoflavitalea rhizosphaerae]
MNKRKFVSFFILTGFVATAMAQPKVVIKGTIKGDLKGNKKVYVFGDNVQQDSVEIRNGRFEIRFPWLKDAVPYIYSEYDSKLRKGPPSFPVVVDGPGTVQIKLDDVTKGLRSGKITGSRSAMAFQDFEEGREKLRDSIKAVMDERKRGDGGKQDTAWNMAHLQMTRECLMPYISRFVEAHADSYIGAFILARYQAVIASDELEKLYNMLGTDQKSTAAGESIAIRIEGMKKAVTGNQVGEFTLNTPKDEPVAFSSFRGKYVLIDFWSSWCGPCKASFPHMKEVYKKYRSDQFEIVGISIDEDKSAWLKELNTQQLPWPQLLDNKKIYISEFAVTGVPTVYLISPEGKIMMKEIGFDKNGNGKIENKLKELFEK